MSKHLHPGKAAFNGVLAADLARSGFTAATRILEGERGFFRAMSVEHDPSRVTDDLGRRWKIRENCYKLHACCGHTHTAIDTALDLRARLGWSGPEAAVAIESIQVATYGPGYEIVREPNPRTPYQAKFSLAYCVAAALRDGRVGLEQFAAERFGAAGVVDPGFATLLARTRIEVDPELTARYPDRWPARLTISLADGRIVSGDADYPRGNPENPVPLELLQAKARDLIAPRYDSALAGRVVAAVGRLEEFEDMAALMRGITGAEA
jgi:2-methylcitrate dehydratase PrpD